MKCVECVWGRGRGCFFFFFPTNDNRIIKIIFMATFNITMMMLLVVKLIRVKGLNVFQSMAQEHVFFGNNALSN